MNEQRPRRSQLLIQQQTQNAPNCNRSATIGPPPLRWARPRADPSSHTLPAPPRHRRKRRSVDGRAEGQDPHITRTSPSPRRPRGGTSIDPSPQHRTPARGCSDREETQVVRGRAAPTEAPPPTTLPQTLCTTQTRRSGVPPPFRRRSGRRRGGEPAAAPGRRGGDGFALSSPSSTVARGGEGKARCW